MEEIKGYFGVGQVYTSRSECNLIVKGNRQLRKVKIPHFERFQLRGEKRIKYEKLKLVVELMRREELIEELGVRGDVEMPMLAKIEQPLNPDYVSGLSDGDGSFYISIRDGRRLKPGFSIIQTGDDGEELLMLVKQIFNGVGGVYRYGNIVRYLVSSVP